MLDKTDEKIIEVLRQNGRATVREVAKRLNLPITTVHNRFKKLRKENAIKKFTIEPNYEMLNKNVSAFVFVTIDHEKLVDAKNGINELKKQLHKLNEVEKIFAVTGDVDVVLFVRVSTIKDLDELLVKKLRSIKGIQKTITQIVLEED